MDVFDFLNTQGYKTVANPKYNLKSKKNTEPAELRILDLNGDNQPGVDMALVDFSNQHILSSADTEKFADLGAHWNPYEDINKQLANQQSNVKKLLNSAAQTLISEIGLGTIKGFSDLFDLLGQVTGFSDPNYSNPVTNVLEEAQEAFKSYVPIYSDPTKNIFNGGLIDAGWWASNIPSIASTLTLLLPSMAITKGLGAIGKTFKIGSYSKKALRAVSRTNRAIAQQRKLDAFQSLVNSSKLDNITTTFLENGTTAVLSRAIENYQEARQTYNEVLPEAVKTINKMSDEDYNRFCEANAHLIAYYGLDKNDRTSLAKGIARASADRTFQMDWLNVGFDIFQMYALRNVWRGKSDVSSSKLRRANINAAKYAGKTKEEIAALRAAMPFKNKVLEKLEDITFSSKLVVGAQLSEGVEEAVNYISQKEGVNLGQILLGKQGSKELGFDVSLASMFDNRILQYTKAPELWDSVFWGVLGGVVFQGAGSVYRRIEAKHKKKSDATDEAKSTLPWYRFDELPEIKRGLSEVEARTIDYNQYAVHLKRIKEGIDIYNSEPNNEVRFETEAEQAIAEAKLRKEFIAKQKLRAMNSGTSKLYDAYLADENLRKAMIESGFFDDYNSNTGEFTRNQEKAERESKEYIEEVKRISQETEALYNEELNYLNAQSAYINGQYDKDFSEKFLTDDTIPIEYLQIIAVNNTINRLQQSNLRQDLNEVNAEVAEQYELIKEQLDPNIDYESSVRLGVLTTQLAYLRATKRKILNDKNQSLSKTVQLHNINKQIESIERQILNNGSRAQLAYATFRSMRYVLDANNKLKETTDEKQNAEAYIYLDHMLAQNDNLQFLEDFDQHDLYHLNRNELSQLTDELIGQYNTLAEDTDIAFKQLLQTVPGYNKALQKKATIESQLASTNAGLVRALSDVKHELSVLHNTMNEARVTAINNAFKTIIDLYKDNPAAVESVITAYIEGRDSAYLDDYISEEDRNKITEAMDILNLAKAYNKGLLSDLNTILRRQDYIKLQEELDALQNNPTTPKEETSQSSTTNQQTISADNNQQVDNTTQESQESNTSQVNAQTEQSATNNTPQPNTEQQSFYCDLKYQNGAFVITNVNYQNPTPTSVKVTTTQKDLYEIDVRNNQTHLQDSRLFDQQGIDHLNDIVVEIPPVLAYDRGKYIVLRKGTLKDTTKAQQQQVPSTGEQESTSNNNDNNTAIDGTVIGSSNSAVESSSTPVEESNPSSTSGDYLIEQESVYDTVSNNILNHLIKYIKANTAGLDANAKQKVFDDYINSEEFKGYTNSLQADNDIKTKAINNSIKIISNLLNRKKASSITEVIAAQSSITEYSSLNSDDNILTEFNSAVDNIIQHYIEYAGLSKINDKYYFNLEDFLRYVNNEIANDKNIARIIFDNVRNYLFSKYNNQYVLIDKNNVVTNDFLQNVNKSEEVRDQERFAVTPGVHSVAINDYIDNLSKSDKAKYDAAFEALNPGDNLYVQVTNTAILLNTSSSTGGTVIGILPTPYVDINNGRHVMYNDGWRTDVAISGTDIESDFYQFVRNIFLNTDENSINLRNILYQLAYNSNTNEQYTKLIEEFAKNPIIDKLLKDEQNRLIKHDATPEQLAKGLTKLLVYSETSNNLGTSENTKANERYQKRIEQSLRSWFTKLYNSYSTINSIKNGVQVNVTISKITDGEVILKTTDTKNAELPHIQGAIANLKPETHKVGVVINDDYITVSGNNVREYAVGMKRGSTFVILPNRSGRNAYVKAYGVSITDTEISDDAKALIKAIKTNLKILINERSVNPSEEAYNNLKEFLFSIFSNDNNKASLFTGVSLSLKRSSNNNEYINLNISGTTNSIIIYKTDKKTGGYSKWYALSDGNYYPALDANDEPTPVHTTLNAILDSLKFNINFSYILSDTNNPISENSFVKKEDNKFVIKIPSYEHDDNTPFRLEYNSYNEFLINNNLLKVNTKIVDGSNFRRRSENQKANQILEVKITPKNQTVAPNTSDFQSKQKTTIQQKTIQEEIIDILQNNTTEGNKGLAIAKLVFKDNNVLNTLERLNLLPKNIIFDENFNNKPEQEGYHAEVNTKTKQVTVGKLWLDMFNNPKTRLQAIRKLIHEQLHIYLAENKGYIKNAVSLYNEFKTKLDSSFNSEWAQDWRKRNNISKDEQIAFFKRFLFDGYNEEAAVEEFLIESLTNANLAELLNNIQADEYKGNRENLLQKIMKFLSDLFGWNVKEGSLYEKELKTLKATFTENKKETVENTSETTINENSQINQEDETEEDEIEEEDEEVDNTLKRKRTYGTIRRRSSITETDTTYTPEMNQIKSEAIANGTFMKAPNGNPTNLTERQWLQVRTKAFKNWFGNWEEAWKIRNNKGRSGLFTEIENDNLEKLNKDFVAYNNVLRKLSFDMGRVPMYKEVNLVDIMKQAGLDKYVHTGYFAVDYNEDIQIDLSSDYDNAQMDLVKLKKKYPELNLTFDSYSILTDDGKKFVDDFMKQDFAQSIYDDLPILNSTSKVVDENGEPLVVYHGGSNTKIFDVSGKKSGGAGIKKGIKGTYFTTSESNAKFYEDIYAFKTGEQWIAYMEEATTEEEIAEINKLWEIEKPATRAFFLNIKTPIETVYTGNNKDGYTENTITPENYDGQHITIEGKSYKEYVAINPNQIKSATENVGTYSTTDNDIRHSSVTETNTDSINVFSNAPNISAFVDSLPIQQRSIFLSLLNRSEISTMC